VSTSAAAISAFATPREQVRSPEEILFEAARALLAGGEVEFKLSTRVGPCHMPTWKFPLYRFFSRDARVPEALRVPPVPAMQRGCYDYWPEALEACETADDQILVMPRNRAYSAGGWDVAVECRPLDPSDAWRLRILQSVFGGVVRADPLEELEDRLTSVEARLTRLEAKGYSCASGQPG
jgi:hypothetical protein